MHLNRYGRRTGAYRDLLEAPLLEAFPLVSPLGTPVVPWEGGGEWFGDAGGGMHRRRPQSIRGRSVFPPEEMKE